MSFFVSLNKPGFTQASVSSTLWQGNQTRRNRGRAVCLTETSHLITFHLQSVSGVGSLRHRYITMFRKENVLLRLISFNSTDIFTFASGKGSRNEEEPLRYTTKHHYFHIHGGSGFVRWQTILSSDHQHFLQAIVAE